MSCKESYNVVMKFSVTEIAIFIKLNSLVYGNSNIWSSTSHLVPYLAKFNTIWSWSTTLCELDRPS